ncbi:hypothetical protein LTS08_002281 [Lithohypha guttulata]|nr:hypothetical protein LTS08_002281 [Lithohypha guttulata]
MEQFIMEPQSRHIYVSADDEIPIRLHVLQRAMEDEHQRMGHMADVTESTITQCPELPAGPSSMLSSEAGPIHPFFRKEAFTDTDIHYAGLNHTKFPISDRLYDALKPSLRLASLFLQRGRSFWMLVLYAIERCDDDGDRYLDPRYTTTKERFDYSRFEAAMERIQALTSIHCHEEGAEDALGCSIAIWLSRPMTKKEPLLYRMSISKQLLALLLDQEIWSSRTLEEKSVVYITIATTLVHEFTHTLYKYRQRMFNADYGASEDGTWYLLPESSVCPWARKELGISWEVFQFGGQAVNGCVTSSSESETEMERFPKGHGMFLIPPEDDKIRLPIAPVSFMSWMHEATWMSKDPMDIFIQHDTEEEAPSVSRQATDVKHCKSANDCMVVL